MKRVDLCALAAIATLAVGRPAAAFEDMTEKLMRLHVASYLVIAECGDAYAIDNGGFKRWADKSGYPLRRLVAPVHAALMIEEDGKYNEHDLIPEVTQMVRAVEKPLEQELARDHAGFCKRLGDELVTEGMVVRGAKKGDPAGD